MGGAKKTYCRDQGEGVQREKEKKAVPVVDIRACKSRRNGFLLLEGALFNSTWSAEDPRMKGTLETDKQKAAESTPSLIRR